MPMSRNELHFFWTYAPRLSFGAMHKWSIREQVEAYDELDVIAAVTRSAGMRSRCLSVLTTRPDVAILSKLGCEPGGEALLALFEGEYVSDKAAQAAKHGEWPIFIFGETRIDTTPTPSACDLLLSCGPCLDEWQPLFADRAPRP